MNLGYICLIKPVYLSLNLLSPLPVHLCFSPLVLEEILKLKLLNLILCPCVLYPILRLIDSILHLFNPILQLFDVHIVSLFQLLDEHSCRNVQLSPLFGEILAFIWDSNYLFLNLRVFLYLYEFSFCL